MSERPRPRPGDFGLKPGGGFAMRLVRWGTGGPYGHAALVVKYDPATSPTAPVQIIEAAPGGVRMQWVRESAFDWSTGGPLDVHLNETNRAAIVAGAWSVIKSNYDWPSVLEFIPRTLFANFKGYWADHPDGDLFCSEMVVWLWRDMGGISMFPSVVDTRKIAPGAVSPNMLAPFLPKKWRRWT